MSFLYPLRFRAAAQVVKMHEGGFVNHPSDPGGATNWGVSLRYLRGVDASLFAGLDLDFDDDGDVDADDIRAMPWETAQEIYHKGWWLKYGYDRLLPPMDVKVFDTAVNMGPRQAHRLLQQSCNELGASLVVDGVLGPKTVATANGMNNRPLLQTYRFMQAQFYRNLAADRPKLAVFLNGWLRRAAA